jgi:hypothetical protein
MDGVSCAWSMARLGIDFAVLKKDRPFILGLAVMNSAPAEVLPALRHAGRGWLPPRVRMVVPARDRAPFLIGDPEPVPRFRLER